MHFRRTVTTDVEIGGQQIPAGDWVLMHYLSANRDEDVFERADEFDVTRARRRPCRLRRRRYPLLPRRPAGPPRTAGDARGAVPERARPRRHRHRRIACARRSSTASSGCRAQRRWVRPVSSRGSASSARRSTRTASGNAPEPLVSWAERAAAAARTPAVSRRSGSRSIRSRWCTARAGPTTTRSAPRDELGASPRHRLYSGNRRHDAAGAGEPHGRGDAARRDGPRAGRAAPRRWPRCGGEEARRAAAVEPPEALAVPVGSAARQRARPRGACRRGRRSRCGIPRGGPGAAPRWPTTRRRPRG